MKCTSPAVGGYFYPDHLPVLGTKVIILLLVAIALTKSALGRAVVVPCYYCVC